MALATTESQFIALANRNYGVWEGSLASYSRAGVETKRQPTILYVWVESKDDAERIASGVPPYRVNFTLRRCAEQRDGTQTFFAGVDNLVGGRALSSAGSMCSSAKYLSRGSPVYIEQSLNYRPHALDRPPVARVRTVVVYDQAGALEYVALFRERPREGEQQPPLALPAFPCSVACVNEDHLVASSPAVHASAESLAGTWVAKSELLGPDGLCDLNVTSTRVVEVQGSSLRIRDTAFPGAQADASGSISNIEQTTDGEQSTLATVSSENGVEHVMMLGGGLVLRLPLVVDLESYFSVEFAWLVTQDKLLSVKRVFEKGAWRQSRFAEETRS